MMNIRYGILLIAFFISGCATNDFKVVDALRIGMNAGEAQETIHAYGFQLEQSMERPALGWPNANTALGDLAGRAGATEMRLGRRILRAEYYPVFHGLLGFGELYLFYSEDDQLVEFYRHQIN